MTTSGSINLTASSLDIIKEALEIVGALEENGTPTSDQITGTQRTLNYMVKSWQGVTNLFAIQKVTVFLEKDKISYSLLGTGDHWTTSFVSTTVSTAASSGASSIEVASITGMSDTNNIGIELADGTMQWTTINGAPSGSTVNLGNNLTDDVEVGAAVFVYATKAGRPMKILNGVRTTFSGTDVPLNLYTLDKYVNLSNKTQTGPVVHVYYDPQVVAPVLYTWPETSSVRDRLTLWVQRSLDDLDNAAGTDDVDYPQEWFLALALNLALLLSTKYGLSKVESEKIAGLANYYKELAEGWDRESDVEIIPDYMPE